MEEFTETVLNKDGEVVRDLIYAARDVANFNNMTDVDFCFEAAVDFLPNTDMEQLILKLKGLFVCINFNFDQSIKPPQVCLNWQTFFLCVLVHKYMP